MELMKISRTINELENVKVIELINKIKLSTYKRKPPNESIFKKFLKSIRMQKIHIQKYSYRRKINWYNKICTYAKQLIFFNIQSFQKSKRKPKDVQ